MWLPSSGQNLQQPHADIGIGSVQACVYSVEVHNKYS